MKKITLFLALFFAGTLASYSQISDAEVDAMINLLGVQKKEAVAKLVSIPKKDSVVFWKIYDEYQRENKKVATDRVKLYQKIALAYDNMTPELADSLTDLYAENRKEQEKSLNTYREKIKKATNSIVAFQFYQTEVYLLTMMRAQIMQQIPTYGELQLMTKKQ